jgi:hypothetical protein
MSKDDYSMNFDIEVEVPSTIPQKSKKSSPQRSTTHEDGKCGYQFSTGANKGTYCNKNTIEDTENCKAHQPKEPKQIENPCSFVSSGGRHCNREATKEIDDNQYCGFCSNIVMKRNEKGESKKVVESKKKVVESKKKVVKSKVVDSDDDDSDVDSD